MSHKYFFKVADGHVDHAFWGRPEEYPEFRPSWKIDADNPGSDLAAEAAAALSARVPIFMSIKISKYSNKMEWVVLVEIKRHIP